MILLSLQDFPSHFPARALVASRWLSRNHSGFQLLFCHYGCVPSYYILYRLLFPSHAPSMVIAAEITWPCADLEESRRQANTC